MFFGLERLIDLALAEDIARALECCAHLVELRRTVVEPFDDFSMVSLEQLQEAKETGGLPGMLLPVDAGLPDWPLVELNSAQRGKFRHGQQFPVTLGQSESGNVRVYGPDRDLLGLAVVLADGSLQPSRVFNLQGN